MINPNAHNLKAIYSQSLNARVNEKDSQASPSNQFQSDLNRVKHTSLNLIETLPKIELNQNNSNLLKTLNNLSHADLDYLFKYLAIEDQVQFINSFECLQNNHSNVLDKYELLKKAIPSLIASINEGKDAETLFTLTNINKTSYLNFQDIRFLNDNGVELFAEYNHSNFLSRFIQNTNIDQKEDVENLNFVVKIYIKASNPDDSLVKTLGQCLTSKIAKEKRQVILKLLLKNKFDINNGYGGNSLLHIAASNGDIELAKELIEEYGANVNNNNNRFKYSPLHEAACKNSVEMVKFLISKGADFKAVDRVKKTALYQAAQVGSNFNTVCYLLSVCGKEVIDMKAHAGRTAIAGAVELDLENEGTELTRAFIYYGADLNVIDNEGNSLLDRIEANVYFDGENVPVYLLLKERGAKTSQELKQLSNIN